MQEVFEKIVEKLEENQTIVFHLEGGKPTQSIDLVKAIEIVKQAAAEYEECYKDCTECEAYEKEKRREKQRMDSGIETSSRRRNYSISSRL